MFAALIPVRSLAGGKQRLAGALPPGQRTALVQAMLEDLLAAVHASAHLHRALVVSSDQQVQQLAWRAGAMLLDDPAGEHAGAHGALNAAIAHGLRWLREAGWSGALVLPGDLPLVTPAELDALVAAASVERAHPDHGHRRVVLASDRAGQGTNALALAPPDLLTPAYGPGSAQAHSAAAARQALPVTRLDAPGTLLDIDHPDDLDAARGLLASDPLRAQRTRRILDAATTTTSPTAAAEAAAGAP